MQIILRPIQDLSNEEKAKLLHLLLSNNIRGFLGNLEQHARNTIHFSESIRVSWAGSTLSAEQWIELARKATQVIDEKRNELAAQPEIFAQELFTGHQGLFTIDFMKKYAAVCPYRFRDGLKFLFDLNLDGKLPFQTDEL